MDHRTSAPATASDPHALRGFVEQALAGAQSLVDRAVPILLDRLQQTRGSLLTASERQHAPAIVLALHGQRPRYGSAFCDALAQAVRPPAEAAGPGASTPSGVAPTAPIGLLHAALDGLALMDENQVACEVELSRATQLLDAAAEWELRQLQRLTSGLLGQAHVTIESNPLRPSVYARALWDAAGVLGLTGPQRIVLLRTSSAVIAPLLRQAWADAASKLQAQGVRASPFRALRMADGNPAALSFDASVPGALEQLKRRLPVRRDGTGGRDAQSPSRAGAHAQPPADAVDRAEMAAALEAALARLDALLQQMPAHAPSSARGDPDHGAAAAATGPLPATSGQRLSAATQAIPRLAEHAAVLQAGIDSDAARQTVELLSRLFDAILADPELQPALRPVMARLQVAALRVALRDASVTQSDAHPMWRLMNALAAAGARLAPQGDPRLDALVAFAEPLARQLAADPKPTSELFLRQVVALEAFLAQQFRETVQAARPVWQRLDEAERAQDLVQPWAARIEALYGASPVDPAIQTFMVDVWARVMALSAVRDGESSAQFLALRAVIDDLAWSLQVPDHPQSRQRLVSMLPKLLAGLRQGMALIRLPPPAQAAVFDALMPWHAQALRPGRPAARHEPVPPAAPLAGAANPSGASFADSLIDLASMDTVPAPFLSTDAQPPAGASQPVDEELLPGRRYRMLLHGQWRAVCLLWRSPKRQFHVVQDDRTGQCHSLTERAARSLVEAGLLKPLVELSLVQRAAEDLAQALVKPP